MQKKEENILLDEILTIESKGIFSDLSSSPKLLPHLLNLNKEEINNAINYIKKVLKEVFDNGHLKIPMVCEDDKLYGYAVIFLSPKNINTAYLHKIFVYDHYRNNGIGSNLLKSSIASTRSLALLCPSNRVDFYKRHGFQFIQNFSLPKTEDFSLSEGLYFDQILMNNDKKLVEAPIFILNNTDIRQIIKTI